MQTPLSSLAVLVVIASACGAIAQVVAGYSRRGFITSMALGFIGAGLGMLIAGSIGPPDHYTLNVEGTSFPIVWPIMGAVVSLMAMGQFVGRRPARLPGHGAS